MKEVGVTLNTFISLNALMGTTVHNIMCGNYLNNYWECRKYSHKMHRSDAKNLTMRHRNFPHATNNDEKRNKK